MIPADLKDSLDLYVEHRIQPGHFLTAVLENNLREAVGRADETSLAHLLDIVRYVYNEIPADCWGSPAKVREWLAGDEAESPETLHDYATRLV